MRYRQVLFIPISLQSLFPHRQPQRGFGFSLGFLLLICCVHFLLVDTQVG